MHKHNPNNNSIVPQAISKLSPRQKEIITELVALLHQPDTPENRNLLRHWWRQLPERLTFSEHLTIMKTLGIIEIHHSDKD